MGVSCHPQLILPLFEVIKHSQDKEIGGQGMEKIAAALATNNTLTVLDVQVSELGFTRNALSINSFEQDSNLGAQGAEKIAKALKINHTLLKLNLQVRLVF